MISALPAAAEQESRDPFLETLVDRATRAQFSQTPDLFALYLSAPRARVVELDNLAVALRERESPRTDQQHGASSSAEGGTTITDKPGISDLLSLAVERGAIMRTTSETTVSLQTTPYLFYTNFGALDNATNWDRLTVLRHLGLTANFSASKDSTAGGVGNFESAEAKYVALGGRSARDRAFRAHVRAKVRSELSRELRALADTTGRLARWISALPKDALLAFDQAVIEFTNWQEAAPKPIEPSDIYRKLAELLGPIQPILTPTETGALGEVVASVVEEESTRLGLAKAIASEAKTWVAAGPELSVVYGFNRDASASDFSRIKLIFGYDSGERMSVNLNAEVCLNHAPQTEAVGGRVRAYSGEAGLTLGRFASNTVDLTMAAKVLHARATGQTTTALQAKANLYLSPAVTVPLALTYANHTDDSPRSRLRLNVGLAINADALLGIAKPR